LQGSTGDIRAQPLETLDGQAAVLQDVSEGLDLTVRKPVLFDEHIPADGLLAALPDLGKLSGQSFVEVFNPAGPGRNIR
jgi:hypothetical protein